MTSNEQIQDASASGTTAQAAEPKPRKAAKKPAAARVKLNFAPSKGKSGKKVT